eukprot:TRINITY_DN49873_c0_g1_i1.p1 TRINITY_DN49873_c0_g1~~TRINITY_DN49873_c0_g1_i1.p1  ORF type:complete len:403 (-),score=37.76 TRINITY_DN49873_c0_g1_i1:179-1348(-)
MVARCRDALHTVSAQCAYVAQEAYESLLFLLSLLRNVLQILVDVIQFDFGGMASQNGEDDVSDTPASTKRYFQRSDDTLGIDEAIEKYAVLSVPRASAWMVTNTLASKIQELMTQKGLEAQVESFTFPHCSLRRVEGVINIRVNLRAFTVAVRGNTEGLPCETTMTLEALRSFAQVLFQTGVAKKASLRGKSPAMLSVYAEAHSDGRGIIRYDLYINNAIPKRLHVCRSVVSTKIANGAKLASWVERWWFERKLQGPPRDTCGNHYSVRCALCYCVQHFLSAEYIAPKSSTSFLFKRFVRYYAINGRRAGNVIISGLQNSKDPLLPIIDAVEVFVRHDLTLLVSECTRAMRIMLSSYSKLSHLIRTSQREMSLLESMLLSEKMETIEED